MAVNYIRVSMPDNMSGEQLLQKLESIGLSPVEFATDYVDDLEEFFSKITKNSISFWIDLIATKNYPDRMKLDILSDILTKQE